MTLLPALLVALPSVAWAGFVTISNVVPRRDNFGAILDAHDSKLNLFEGVYYWHAASYGNCTEPKGSSGCGVPIGGCGFQTDHNVTLYTTTDLVTWKNEGVAFGAQGNLPPDSVLFAPKTVFNPTTKTWVMYFNYITGGFGNSYYGIATSPTPQGPFSVVNPNIQLVHTDNGDENLFVDDDGTGYIIYTSLSVGHSISIERLTPDYLNSTLVTSGVFGDSFVEAPAMFKRGNVYYATFGSCCCYCQSGSPVSVYTATSPLGPYTKRNVLGSSPRLGAVEPTVPAPSPALAISRQDSLQAKPTAVDVTPSNPFCGFNHQENTFYLSLFCVNGVIDSLPFVSYGTPTGSCPGPFVRSSCDSASFISYATATCVGQPNCTLTAPITPDPCLGTVKSIAVIAHCSEGPGGYATIPPPPPPPPPPPGDFGSQQTDVFAYVDAAGEQQFMYIGDHWQSAPDGLKAHDFTVWAPLIFSADGNISSPPGFQDNFTVSVGT